MGYTKEEQNEYNKKYYARKKAEIAAKQSAKEVCKYCGRSIRHDIYGSIPKQSIARLDVHSTRQ